ncbi:hypothetical protein [Prosthecobacter sp.]|uniref:hypothetical protein n=1 Tax=Prosthecobacter sp. TaxID=1965333 RepID=UPI003784B2D8
MLTPPKTTQHADPRTAQFIELLIGMGFLAGLHFISYRLVAWANYSEESVALAVIGTLALALTVALALVINKRWHWGQFIYFVVVACCLSFLQLIFMSDS